MSEQTKTTKPVDNDPNSLKNRECGAIWKNEKSMMLKIKNKDGNEIKFLILENRWKEEGSKQPDFRVYRDAPNPNSAPAPKKVDSKPKQPTPKKVETPATEESNEEFV